VPLNYSNRISAMKKTFDQLLSLAEQDNAQAQNNLALRYFKGDGVAQDKKEGVYWFTKAAKKDYALAQFNLAICYDIGDGVAQDKQKAVELYTKAADQGLKEAQNNLAHRYLDGDGVTQDKQKAMKLYTKAADQGLKEAQFNLALCYFNGDGVKQDKTKAVEKFRQSAAHDSKNAQKRLAKLYEKGIEGVLSPNESRAAYWEERAKNKKDNKSDKTETLYSPLLAGIQMIGQKNHDGQIEKKLEEKEYVIAFIDLLGSKEKINSEDEKRRTLNEINKLYDWARNFKEIKIDNIDKLKWKIFSDNIVIAMPTEGNEEGRARAFFAVGLSSAFFQAMSMEIKYTLRGGITMGNFYFDETFVWGQGLVNAYKLENEMAINPRLIISHECEKYIDEVLDFLSEQKVLNDSKITDEKSLVFTKDYDYWYINYQFICYLKHTQGDTGSLDTICEFLIEGFDKHKNNEKVQNKDSVTNFL